MNLGSSGGGSANASENGPTVEYKMRGYNVVTTYGQGFSFHSGIKMVYKDGYIYRAYASTSQFGWPQFVVFDVRNPEAPRATYIGSSLIPDTFGELAAYDKYIYAITQSSVSVFDVSYPTAPVLYKGVLTFQDKATDIEIQGKYAYIGFDTAYSSLSFRIVDLSHPLQPKVVGGLNIQPPGAFVNEIAVSGKWAYLTIEAGSPNSFYVVDISDPYNPVASTATHPSFPSEIRDITIKDNYLYGVSWFQSSAGLVTVDITNPANAVLVSTLTLPNPGISLYIAGNYAFCGLDTLVDPNDSLRIVDISNPLSPKFVTTEKLSIQNDWRSIVGVDQYVYLGGFVTASTLLVLKMPNIQVPAIETGQLTADNISVQQRLQVEKNVDVMGGINVGPSGVNSVGPGVFRSVAVSTESIVGITTPTWQNVMLGSKNNGVVFTTGTTNAWQYRRLDGATLVGD